MKKILSTVLALAVATMMTTSAFAATAIDTNGATSASNKEAGDYTLTVKGEYNSGTTDDGTVSVDIMWENLSFTYNKGSKGDWNTGTHSYDNAVASGWSADKKGITVKNHSNVAVEANFSFTAETDVYTTGTFYSKNGDDYNALDSDKQKIGLYSAEGTTRDDDNESLDESPKGTIYFGVSGDSITADKSLGTITVKIAKADYIYDEANNTYTVFTANGLQTTFNIGGYIKLGTNIETTDPIELLDKTVTLDLNGNTLKYNGREMVSGIIYAYGETASLTIKDSSTGGNGKIVSEKDVCGINVFKATFIMESGTIENCGSGINIACNASVTINGGTIIAKDTRRDAVAFTDAGPHNSLTINGGTIVGGRNAIVVKSGCVATVSAGNFTGEIINDNDGGDIVITGGTYSVDPTSYVNTENCTVTENDNGTWTVTEK